MAKDLRAKARLKVLEKISDAILTNQVQAALTKTLPSQGVSANLIYQPPAFHTDCYWQNKSLNTEKTCQRNDIVFITGRFRSGSTLVWNIFHNLDQFTAYYEPFNERQWFDANRRGTFVDYTHQGVKDYWVEYKGLECLSKYYDEDWIRHHLFMRESDFNFQMKRYIEILIERAPSRPVLQFNRVDFRLGWLSRQFPNSKIIHIYRNPRDQWCSVVGKPDDFPYTESSHFKDRFYLEMWCKDLRWVFPFLDKKVATHPYQQFYLLWRLSFIMGKQYSDLSINLETLCNDQIASLESIANVLGIDCIPSSYLSDIIKPYERDKWTRYADGDWFTDHESFCERLLYDYFMSLDPAFG
ncbi:MAG: sulfotransferase [Pseudomonadota bacterium]|nr:sulfotransferase [Pseudomonadota bacterium]